MAVDRHPGPTLVVPSEACLERRYPTTLMLVGFAQGTSRRSATFGGAKYESAQAGEGASQTDSMFARCSQVLDGNGRVPPFVGRSAGGFRSLGVGLPSVRATVAG